MFTDFSLLMARSDIHRAELLAEADQYRLARLAASIRRRPRRGAPPAEPPEPPSAPPVRTDVRPARNHDADRRYAVPR